MPKLRAVRTKEEAELVPPTESVAIDLSPAPIPAEKEPDIQVAPKQPEQVTEPPAEDSIKLLKEQLEQSKNAEKAAQDALIAAQQREQSLARERDESRAHGTTLKQEADEAKYTAVVNALGGAIAEAEAAQQAWEAADIAADSKSKAEAQRRLTRAEANVARFEDAKDNMEARREQAKREPPPRPQAPSDPVEAALATMPTLPSNAQTWLRSHPEYLTDVPKNAKLQALHWEVVRAGHPQFSQGYFQDLEERLGLRQKAQPTQEDIEVEEPPAPQPRRTSVPSAPPSRDVPSGGTGQRSKTRVELTPEEREIARLSGVDEVTYARGKLELERRKSNGLYQERN